MKIHCRPKYIPNKKKFRRRPQNSTSVDKEGVINMKFRACSSKTINLTILVPLHHVFCCPLHTDQYGGGFYENNNIAGSGIQNRILETRQNNEKKSNCSV